jgi:hypothetical protein
MVLSTGLSCGMTAPAPLFELLWLARVRVRPAPTLFGA